MDNKSREQETIMKESPEQRETVQDFNLEHYDEEYYASVEESQGTDYFQDPKMVKAGITQWRELLPLSVVHLHRLGLSEEEQDEVINDLDRRGLFLRDTSQSELFRCIDELYVMTDKDNVKVNKKLDYVEKELIRLRWGNEQDRKDKWVVVGFTIALTVFITVFVGGYTYFRYRQAKEEHTSPPTVQSPVMQRKADILVAPNKDVVLVVPGCALMCRAGSDSLSVEISSATKNCSAIILSSVPEFSGETTVTVTADRRGSINMYSYIVKRNALATQTVYDMREKYEINLFD